MLKLKYERAVALGHILRAQRISTLWIPVLLTRYSTRNTRSLCSSNFLYLEKMVALICGCYPVFFASQPLEYWYNREEQIRISKKDVRRLGVRERIRSIRLMDKVNKNPAAAEKLGTIFVNGSGDQVKPGLEKL